MKTTKENVIIPDLFTEAVQGVFAGGVTALWGTGVAVVNDTFTGDSSAIGSQIKVPYFSSIGEFQDVVKDGDALVPQQLSQSMELATVVHAGLAFEVTKWARSSIGKDIYDEGARQVLEAGIRKADSYLIAAASNATAKGALVKSVYSPSNPRTLDWDLLIDGKMLWGDEQENIALITVHSKVLGDLLKLKRTDGSPLLVEPRTEGALPTMMGIPIGVSDRMPLDGSTMSAVTAQGTTPPTVGVRGSPTGPFALRVEITAAGALGTAFFRWSTDGGTTFSDPTATAPTLSLPGTGLFVDFAAGNYAANNVYTSSASLQHTTVLYKRGSLAFWYNRALLQLETDKDILAHTDVAALHLYGVAHRYVRMPGRRKSGCVIMRHN
jgi:hypothetical protein